MSALSGSPALAALSATFPVIVVTVSVRKLAIFGAKSDVKRFVS